MQTSTLSANDHRATLLAAARQELSGNSYEQVGLRQVAARAGIDTARLVREFGSKEHLLQEVLEDTFQAWPTQLPPTWPQDIAAELTGQAPVRLTEPFRIIVYSAPSPAAESLVQARVSTLLGRMAAVVDKGPEPGVKAAMAAAVIFGVILTRDVIGLEPLSGGRQICASSVRQLLESLQPGPIKLDTRPSQDAPEPRPFGVVETKAAILKAADAAFSRLGYEHATIRGIAAAADADPALIVRYFGSKEGLFHEVLQHHFAEPKTGQPDFPLRIASTALAEFKGSGSPLDITLRSAPSPTAREILRKDIEDRFLRKYSEQGGSEKVAVPALMNTALFMGASFCNSILRVPAIHTHRTEAIQELAGLIRLAWGLDHKQA